MVSKVMNELLKANLILIVFMAMYVLLRNFINSRRGRSAMTKSTVLIGFLCALVVVNFKPLLGLFPA